MTNQEDYSERVADLVSTAFDNMGEALKQPAGAKRNGLTDKAKLQVAAAQVLATLNLSREQRIRNLIALADVTLGGAAPDPALVREAYATAAIAMGLVEDEDAEAMSTEELLEALGHGGKGDPADADLGDLK